MIPAMPSIPPISGSRLTERPSVLGPLAGRRSVIALLAALALATLGVTGCGAGEAGRLAGDGVRDTLPDGTPVLRYAALAGSDEATTLTPELRIGSLDGDGPDVFGDVRGIEAGPDGEIYVLDYAAAEVRVFSAAGVHLRTIARRGEGPGELGNSNGFVLVGDTLWVHDHSKMVMMGLSTEGGELARSDVPVRSYGYLWMGTRDRQGRFWKMTSHSDAPRTFPPEEGLQESTSRTYHVVYDPATQTRDSIFFGERGYRSWVARRGEDGYSMRGIPFESAVLTVVDPSGGFWQADGSRYRVARLDAEGDTVLVIEADVPARPVTDADREAFAAPMAQRSPEEARMAEDILRQAPETQPVLKALFVDEGGRLWVERTTGPDEPALFDVFSAEGEYRGSIRFGFEASPYFTPRIRNGRLYTLVQDDFDVPYVVRATLPPWAATP